MCADLTSNIAMVAFLQNGRKNIALINILDAFLKELFCFWEIGGLI